MYVPISQTSYIRTDASQFSLGFALFVKSLVLLRFLTCEPINTEAGKAGAGKRATSGYTPQTFACVPAMKNVTMKAKEIGKGIHNFTESVAYLTCSEVHHDTNGSLIALPRPGIVQICGFKEAQKAALHNINTRIEPTG